MIQGFKNIIKATSFIDQSFQQLLKKTDDNRKLARMSLEHLHHIHRFLESFSIHFQQLLLENNQICQQGIPFNSQLYVRLQKVFAVQHDCTKKLNNSIKQTIQKSNDIFNNYSNLIISFQLAIRNYTNNLQTLAQSSKRYFKTHKSLINNLQQYKLSFTDVKLIYNTDQRIKRYNTCELNYKTLTQELKYIESKLPTLSQFKKEVILNYKNIQYQFVSALKLIGNQIVTLSELFVFQFNNMFKSFTALLHQQPFIQSKFTFSLQKTTCEQCIDHQLNKQGVKQYSSFSICLYKIKPEFYSQIGKIHHTLIKDISDKLQARKKTNRHLYQFTASYFKQFQKIFNGYLKDINSNYQKNKKKISQLYGKQHKFFIKSFSIIFEKIAEQVQLLTKSVHIKLKSTENIIQEEFKLIDSFLKEIKTISDKIVIKKTTKNQMEQDINQDQELIRLQTNEKSLFLKITQNQSQLSINYNGILNDLLIYSQSLHQFCNQFHKQQLGQINFHNKYKQFQVEVDEIMKNKTVFFAELSFGNLLLDNNQDIVFQPELNKVEEFKKIKKPIEYQSQKNEKAGQIIRKISIQQQLKNIDAKRVENNQQNVKANKQQNLGKNEQFLQSKVVFQEDEKLIDTFKCGLSDKIILSGKLYVTNQRICFHSKFNPNNVFFGDTFLQIPKKDIIKVQKRQNAIIFNNSISITTVNGQVFFTSFFSRNEAFDLICQIFEINNNQDLMFQPSQDIKINYIQEEQSQQDDLASEKVLPRCEEIDKILQKLDYLQVHESIYTFEGLNAFKFFKMFETYQQISYNRKTFKGFNMVFKQFLQHKDIVLGQWSPDLASFINSANIKQVTPFKFSKIDKSVIPVPNSGIPLMPKIAQMQQQLSLYLYSKDKYIIQTKVQNFGVPYCEYFNIRYKKVVETVEKNKVRMKIFYFIDFVQKTMMKSVIQSKSIEESKLTCSKYENQIKKYLKYIEKIQNKSSKNISKDTQQEQRIKELQFQLQQTKQCSQKKAKEAIQTDKYRKRERKILYASVLLNILLLLALISIY